MNQKRLKLCLIVISLVSAILFCGATEVKAEDKPPTFEELVAAQARAVAANEALWQYFYASGYVVGYPNYINGCYIEDNVLHIRLVSPTEQEMAALNKVLSNYKDVITYEYGRYSHSELMEYAEQVAAELEKQGCEVTGWGVDGKTDNIVMGILPEHLQAAKALLEKKQADVSGNTLPEIALEGRGYTVLD